MTRVGWLADAGNADGTLGGAELTQREFRDAAPEGVDVIDCPAGAVVEGLDRYVLHNVVGYALDDFGGIGAAIKYHHDIGPHIRPEVWRWLGDAQHICCSPLQREFMELDAAVIPPAIPLERFREAARNVNGSERGGCVAVGPWMNPAKNPEAAARFAIGHGGITFIGGGPLAPPDSEPVPYDDLPQKLARFKTFVHLPREIEPCGRSAIEAAASGCGVVLNRLVGARHWLENEPEALDSAARDFWQLVLGKD